MNLKIWSSNYSALQRINRFDNIIFKDFIYLFI